MSLQTRARAVARAGLPASNSKVFHPRVGVLTASSGGGSALVRKMLHLADGVVPLVLVSSGPRRGEQDQRPAGPPTRGLAGGVRDATAAKRQ